MTKPLSSARLRVRVVPRSSRTELVGWLGDQLKIKVAAPPQDGRANDALTVFLAAQLGVPKRHVRVASGHGASSKVLEIDGLSQPELIDRLEELLR